MGSGADGPEPGGAWVYGGPVRAGVQGYVAAYEEADEAGPGAECCPWRASGFAVDDG